MRRIEYLIQEVLREGNTNSDCMEWPFALDTAGYGVVKVPNSSQRNTHRVAYELVYGEIGPGLDLHHECENPPCFNPRHLEPLTRQEHSCHTNKPAEIWTLVCPQCDGTFQKAAGKVRGNRKQGKAGPFCGKSCASKYTNTIATNGRGRNKPK